MSNGKTLVIYFSRADENYNVGTVEVGNTELLAKEIIAKTGADEFKIIFRAMIRFSLVIQFGGAICQWWSITLSRNMIGPARP